MAPLYSAQVLTQAGLFTEGIEGPACDASGMLYACNFGRQGTVGVVTPEGEAYLFIELPQGSTPNGMRFTRDQRMLLADYSGHNILQVDMKSRKVSVWAHHDSLNQPNDLCITASGIVFASDPKWSDSTGQLWRCLPEGRLECLEQGMGTTNGIEVSPDEKTLYVNESAQRRIWAYDLSPSGGLSRKRLFHEFPDHGLDGMRCDVEGSLYVTRYGKGSLAKLNSKGLLLREMALHGRRPSNVAFGGEDGCTLYVTEVEGGRIEQLRVEAPGREWKLAHD